MHRSSLLGVILTLLAAAPLPAYAEEPKAPPEVAADAEAILTQDPFIQRDKVPAKLYRAVDVTGDGEKDWVLDFMQAQSGRYCGTGGCPIRVWVRDRDSGLWRLEVAIRHFRYSLNTGGGISLNVHGVHCDKTGAEDCKLDYVWSAVDKRFIERPRAEGDLLYIKPARPPREDEMPAALRAARDDFASACVQKGGKANLDSSAASIPDINGDGVRDWVFNGVGAFCDKDGDQIMPPCAGGACETEAYVTDATAPGGARRVFQGPVFWLIGFHRKGPADLMVVPFDADCNGPGQAACVFEKAALAPQP